MSVENEPIIPVQVKYIEVQSATLVRNEKIPRKTPEPRQPNGPSTVLQNGLCQSPVAAENIQVSHSSPLMSPCAGSPTNPLIPNKFQFDPNLSYAEKVAHEMIVTEKIYLENLKQIIDGFLEPVTKEADLEVSRENIDDLFINVEEIYQFNWVLLQDMQKCNYDPVKLAECFVIKQVGFDIYTKYCTHYPRSMEVQLEWNQREDTANFIKRQQESLGHTLPLCSFLLKPVQRILKYHLLLGNIAKHFKPAEDEEGYEIIQKALSAMTNVAKHINDMKRKHEDAVHLQEIQSVLLDYEGPSLTSFGSIVLEDTFRLHGTKTGRYLFLFEKALLITKRRSDGTFSWKATVVYSNMMLADSVFREPLTFQVIPFDDRKICYTFVSRDLDTKHAWLLELKKRLLDSYAAAVPMKAKQIILGHGKKDNEKENDEPSSVRRSSTRKGANQQRQLSKENSSHTLKVSKNSESDRRKSKDNDEAIEEKTKTSIDSFKSPLRRKLRVFTKRKFNKDSGKSSKRVSWSSDDNNDDIEKELLTVKTQKEESQERKINAPSRSYDKEKQNTSENKYHGNNENEVSISSLLRDGKTMVSVSGEEDNHLSDQVQLRGSHNGMLPSKKRRIGQQNRQKCKSMPPGQFPIIYEDGEFLTVDKNECILARTHSLSHLYGKFVETEQIDTSINELQKYGPVNLSESNATRERMGSNEQLALEESIHHSSDVDDVIPAQTDDVIPAQTDDVITEAGQSVHQTLKRVSMAFSDVSPNFSPEKSPTSSIEDMTNEDITEDFTGGDLTTEDLTTGDLTPDEYTAGDLTPEEYTAGDLTPEEYTAGDLTQEEDIPEDLSLDYGGTGSPLPDEMFNGQTSPGESVKIEDTGKIEDSEEEYKGGMENGVAKDWNGTSDIEHNHDSLYEGQSNQDSLSVVYSEPSSYVDTLSDYSCDEQGEQSWLRSFSSSYQRVFTLKRCYSEENLISKYPFDDTRSEGGGMASKSYTHIHHAPVVRSRSEDCSKRSQNSTRPFTFSVTPKKKIVIKDSLWETIKEDAEKNHHEILVAKDVHTLRRRKKRRSGHKKNKVNRTHSSEGRMEGTRHVVRTCAKLNMADYREPEYEPEGDLKTESINSSNDNAKSDSQERLENNCDSASSNLPEKTSNNDETVVSTSQEIIENNCENTMSNSHEITDNNPTITKIAVALRKRRVRTNRDKSLVNVDENESEVPSTINYLCIETHPADESPSSDGASEPCSRDVKRTNGNAASKVERLSKYFNKVTTESKGSGKHNINKHGEVWRKSCSIKKRVEELSKRDVYPKKTRKNSEEQLMAEGVDLHSLQNIQDRIGVLRRSTLDDNQTTNKSILELTSSLNHGKPNVRQLKNKLEELDSEQDNKQSHENGISKKVSASLRVRNRIQELGQNPEKKPEQNADDDLRTCTRLKERIERLQKGAKKPEVDPGRDITISDDNDTNQPPKHNEELRTLVIKRGWVQQFIQRIETGS